MGLKVCLIAAVLSSTCPLAGADPATPPSQAERDYQAIGGGLYVLRGADFYPDKDGNILVKVFSVHGISAGGHYSLDTSPLWGGPSWDGDYDGGTLGELRGQGITIDCTHRSYEVINARKIIPEPIWRPATTLPQLDPLFRYVCAHS